MNINTVKCYVMKHMDKKYKFKYSGMRGFSEEFIGLIVNAYNGIFLIKVDNDDRIKSFSYSDVLIGNLKIQEC